MSKTAELVYEKTIGETNIAKQIRQKNSNYKVMSEGLESIENQLIGHLSEENKRLFMKYNDVINSLFAIELKEYFIEGFEQGITS